ncbi:hypothetical protein DIS24_g11194 [Lasiodiplodia hormozganensis]|uniref:Uncharacterized protein n=1 Tax=Lasiodiplodia hormozganensis TaxID=869390 RepID=A0AA39WZN2_9PEZI|nr:hypothetical protein DIS24_g11194 [Lasiodiplodia hormozganensis]
MTTTWIRLSLYGGDETTKTFLIPTLNISTYSDLTKAIHSIFRISAEAFPSFDVHTENDTECDEAVVLLSPHLWDLGLYFSHAPEKAVEVFVHFKPPVAPTTAPTEEEGKKDKDKEEQTAGSPIKSRAASPKDEQHQHHQEWQQDEIDAAEALLALSRAQPEPQLPQLLPSPQPQQHHPQSSSKRARNSSTTSSDSSDSSSSGSSPIVRKRPRARSAPPARSPARQPSSSSSAPLSSVPSSGLSSPPADDVLDAQAVDLQQQQQQQQQQREQEQDSLAVQEQEEEQPANSPTPPAPPPPPPAPQTVTLHLRYTNRMTRSHGATVPDLVLRAVPASRRLADVEDVVKNHACEAFLLLTMGAGEGGGGGSGRGRRQKQKLTQRQGLELVECLAVRVLVDGYGGGDALRERRSVGEYATVVEGEGDEGQEGEEKEERVVRGTVEMWREEHIAMEVLRRESPTGDEE